MIFTKFYDVSIDSYRKSINSNQHDLRVIAGKC